MEAKYVREEGASASLFFYGMGKSYFRIVKSQNAREEVVYIKALKPSTNQPISALTNIFWPFVVMYGRKVSISPTLFRPGNQKFWSTQFRSADFP